MQRFHAGSVTRYRKRTATADVVAKRREGQKNDE
jgi:hypothetical protein